MDNSMRRKILKLTQRFYILHVLIGLIITTRHFFVNLWGHIMDMIGVRTHNYTVTYEYPERFRMASPRTRTRHRLTQREDGSPRCVACMMCETVCPAYCIEIVAKEHPDPNIEKAPLSFNIDLGRCVFCGFCVEACPEDAIRMDTGVLNIASYSRDGMLLNMEQLLNPPEPIRPKENVPNES